MAVLPLLITILLFCIGIAGTILPLLPGVTIVWGAMLLYGIMTGFPQGLTLGFYIGQTLAVILTMGIDYIATAYGVRRSGGSKAAMWGAALGLLIFGLLMPPIGIILGPFLGALAGELLTGSHMDHAVRTSINALIGLLSGIVIKLVIVAAMIFWFFQRISPLW